jgi:hypothetical protein
MGGTRRTHIRLLKRLEFVFIKDPYAKKDLSTDLNVVDGGGFGVVGGAVEG